MDGLLIVNPRATSSTPGGARLVADALGEVTDVTVAITEYPGHARELAASTQHELVIVLGGDGSVNEVVNGLMRRGPDGTGRPALLALPGGGGNVFTQGLGLPGQLTDAVAAASRLLGSGPAGLRTIGLGLAGQRYFTFSAGLGLDAEVIEQVNQFRAQGRRETDTLYLRALVRRYLADRYLNRPEPSLTLERDGAPVIHGIHTGIITNSAPWTYFRGRPLLAGPDPDFSSGLDLIALRRMRAGTLLRVITEMMMTATRAESPASPSWITALGLGSLTFRCARPTPWHVDGEHLGLIEAGQAVRFTSVPGAIQVIAPPAARRAERADHGPPVLV